MPAPQEPQQQAPMEMSSPTTGVVSQQPAVEPQPDMSLRGGEEAGCEFRKVQPDPLVHVLPLQRIPSVKPPQTIPSPPPGPPPGPSLHGQPLDSIAEEGPFPNPAPQNTEPPLFWESPSFGMSSIPVDEYEEQPQPQLPPEFSLPPPRIPYGTNVDPIGS
ncbi:hypothetical protein O1611_g3950 [Lasiodiplodia mahajangana]|uniref:Uncharacterized protein n=1 Tax=Lasiodiplodia mahajangana TaxID=1108764 RepID=A0ACC2JQ95_9PEZI|nr:hypothetical protein O1611_g3950 [Lasiodiplodia mahajangana]